MNIKLCAASVVLALGLSAPAAADFSGYYAIANWTLTDNAFGSVDTSTAPSAITLTSGNSQVAGDTLFTITAPATENISFNWSYVTNDLWGESSSDPFGYVINGVTTLVINELQDSSIPTQSGTAHFTVNAGDVFGFDANTLDGYNGSAVTVASGFTAVPLPGAVWLFSAAIAGLGCFSRSRRSKTDL